MIFPDVTDQCYLLWARYWGLCKVVWYTFKEFYPFVYQGGVWLNWRCILFFLRYVWNLFRKGIEQECLLPATSIPREEWEFTHLTVEIVAFFLPALLVMFDSVTTRGSREVCRPQPKQPGIMPRASDDWHFRLSRGVLAFSSFSSFCSG